MNDSVSSETKNFNADVARLLDIVANALYSNSDVFLRELISNASDACDRLRYEALHKPDLVKNGSDFRIIVRTDTSARTLCVIDNGIGMTRQDMIDHLGTIAKSGTRGLMEQIASSTGKQSQPALDLIGQFGVGFYASFMVAHKVEVISRFAGTAQVHVWSSDGKSGYEIRPAAEEEKESLINSRGTCVRLHIRAEYSELFIEEKLRHIIETYSDHIDIPIYLQSHGLHEKGRTRGQSGSSDNDVSGAAQEDADNKKNDQVPVNQASALWTRPRNEISKEQYKEFFWHLNAGMRIDEPALISHWQAEGKIEFTALLFVPTMRPWDLYDPGRKHSVRLYVRRVFITDQCEGLVFPWLRFLKGVIDSRDLPLNISREMLQHNPVIGKIRSSVARRVLSDLAKLADKETVVFNAFWEQFGSVLKEGLYDAIDHRKDILKVCRFRSSHDDGRSLISVSDYIERMKEKQDSIYYISGEKLETLANSPQLEGFKDRGVEVLFMTDPVDEFWIQAVGEIEGHSLKSITKGDIDLSAYTPDSGRTDSSAHNADKNAKKNDDVLKNNTSDKTDAGAAENIDGLVARFSDILKDDVGYVRVSQRLTRSPVCLVAGEMEVDMRTEQILRIQQKYDPKAKRVLELNPSHPLIQNLNIVAEKNPHSEELKDAAYLLLDQARIIQGNPVPDPSRFARLMSVYLEKAVASGD